MSWRKAASAGAGGKTLDIHIHKTLDIFLNTFLNHISALIHVHIHIHSTLDIVIFKPFFLH